MTPDDFVMALKELRMESVFNPYSDVCPIHYQSNAAEIRSKNLLLLLKKLRGSQVHSIWIGRDLGYRGGRRTGVPLTDEVHLRVLEDVFKVKLFQATSGPPVSERTAGIIWQILPLIPKRVFLWNVFPFHPYEKGQPLSNRCHSREERDKGSQFLLWLLKMLEPHKVVAIGNDAEAALRDLNLTCYKVRHPSYGGQNEFIEGMAQLYKIALAPNPQSIFNYLD